MTSRSEILARVRRHQPPSQPLPDLRGVGGGLPASVERFATGVTRMGARVLAPPADGDLTRFVQDLFPGAAVICSATAEVQGNRLLAEVIAPADLADVDVGVVRAVFGVAETGSVWLTDREFGVSALGFLSQHLVVLLDPAMIVSDIHDAYRERARFDTGYGVLMTGPSATADIEGILIHGAQGIRSMTIVPVPAR